MIQAPRFTSPLVNDRNYELSGISRWQDLIERVTTRSKPVGFVNCAAVRAHQRYGGQSFGFNDPMREAARRGIDAGCCVRLDRYHDWREPEPTFSCAVSISGRVADVFDLDALLADYRAYARAAGAEVAASIVDEFGANCRLRSQRVPRLPAADRTVGDGSRPGRLGAPRTPARLPGGHDGRDHLRRGGTLAVWHAGRRVGSVNSLGASTWTRR